MGNEKRERDKDVFKEENVCCDGGSTKLRWGHFDERREEKV